MLGFVAFAWVALAIDAGLGVLRVPSLKRAVPLGDAECPTVSILFAARDEEEKLPGALATFLALDYPRYEVVAVNDRSEDATATILDSAAREDARLKVIRVTSLPAGWLGKPYALQRAYENSKGEWLVLTDADVHFAPDVLRRAIGLAQKNRWDHMPLLAEAKMYTFGEKAVMTFFALAFVLATRPWRVNKPHSAEYIGVGAFQKKWGRTAGWRWK
jgi:glycosyltransferase involved in cell wall biosynthesis